MISQELVLYDSTLVNLEKKMYKFIYMKEGERQTYRKRETDSKTDKIIYQNLNTGGMKRDLNFLLCLLICIFSYGHDSLKMKAIKLHFKFLLCFQNFTEFFLEK